MNDARIIIAICAGERYTLWKLRRAITRDLDLYTIWIELRATLGVG